MSQLQQVLVQLERAKLLIRDEAEPYGKPNVSEAIKVLERIRVHLIKEPRLESLPHSL